MKKLYFKKKLTKEDKETNILLGLIDLYIKSNAPIGSNFLKENFFKDMSSATIRNYFSKLEEKGYLEQVHISGGRVPTSKAFKKYAEKNLDHKNIDKKDLDFLNQELIQDSKKITDFLIKSAESLSNLVNASVFLSLPRFDQDYISNIKLILLEDNKILCVIVTDFGMIKTQTLYIKKNVSEKLLSKIEEFFLYRMSKANKPFLMPEEKRIATHLYNEIMIRYVVGYASCNSEYIYKTGLSKLLSYDEFKDPIKLAECLSIFENSTKMNQILLDTIKNNQISFYIADDLLKFDIESQNSSIICMSYKINEIIAGAVVLLLPIRAPYKKIFAILKEYTKNLSNTLTKNIYKYKISFHSPLDKDLKKLNKNNSILLEDKSK
ncbi:MAG: Heat-inducible transcription repressor HrcA [Candidatus Anoxychlamydiales bacterium]|nr:Heat-inducible transcription repressor HrcA [Candidatus Anoxychlamydiales bacterium]